MKRIFILVVVDNKSELVMLVTDIEQKLNIYSIVDGEFVLLSKFSVYSGS